MKCTLTYEVELLPEDQPVRGNVMDSGDKEYDKKVEDEVIAQLDRGEYWAWCVLHVTAKLTVEGATKKLTFEGEDYLGGCSGKSEEEVLTHSDYIDDMKENARANLKERMLEDVTRGQIASMALDKRWKVAP